MDDKNTASYKIVREENGNRYKFYCDLSGALMCTTQPYCADTEKEELQTAWEREGQQHFNRCHKCGRWIIDAMYNVEVLECVECAPYKIEKINSSDRLRYSDMEQFGFGPNVMKKTKVCPKCGEMVKARTIFCSTCGERLRNTLFSTYKRHWEQKMYEKY